MRARIRRLPVRRMARAAGVSVTTTVLSLCVLGALTITRTTGAATANVIATIAGIGPSYLLNRRYTWGRSGKSDVRRELLPFWTMCLLALVVSTVTVGAVGRLSEGAGDVVRSALVCATSVATFAALWVVQFVVCDRLLFVDRRVVRPVIYASADAEPPLEHAA